jgi:hypothetical protein
MTQPGKDDIVHFMQVFQILSLFEAQQHLIRGAGAFDRRLTAMPDPIVAQVMDWLEELT